MHKKVKVGDRVRDIHGNEGLVIETGMTGPFHVVSSVSVARVRYDDGSERPSIYASTLTVLPPEEPIRAGDRVRHNGTIHTYYRRKGGKVLSVGGAYALIQWDGLDHEREELLSQLEVVHHPKTEASSTSVGAALELLRAEHKIAAGKIEELQAYKDSLSAAIDILTGAVA